MENQTKRVLILDNVDPVCDEILKQNNIEVDRKIGASIEEVIELSPAYHGFIVRSYKLLDPKFYQAATLAEAIGRAGTGVDNIVRELADKKKIMIINTPTSNSPSVAELTIAHMLGLARSLVYADNTTKEGSFEKKGIGKDSIELEGKTLGIIGFGNIGSRVAKKSEAFDMNVIYFDPYVTSQNPAHKKVSLEDVFKKSDIVTVHVPNLAQTEGLITKELLSLLKDNAFFINTARAKIIKGNPQYSEGNALYDILKERKDLKAAVDVYDEDKPKEQPLSQFDYRVILTPHTGASTKDALKRGAVEIAEQFIEFFQYGRAPNSVNYKIPDEAYPFLALTEKLALLGANLIGTMPKKLEISCYGELNKHGQVLSTAAANGIMQYTGGEYVSYMKILEMVKEKGLTIEQRIPDEKKGYLKSVTIDLVINGKRTSLRGSLNEDGEPIISRIDNFFVNFTPKEPASIFIYEDKPGVMEAIGALYSERGINIKSTTIKEYEVKTQETKTGRYDEKKTAMCVVNPIMETMSTDDMKNKLLEKGITAHITNVNFKL